jgi:NAD(P)-dependent dehydrogenase (short-subunit alcohol dehydrogenase family)
MRAQKSGTIINISSGSTWRAMPGITLYAASKAAINGLFSLSLPVA